MSICHIRFHKCKVVLMSPKGRKTNFLLLSQLVILAIMVGDEVII